MNFLAHCHLSHGDDELLIGNLCADFLGPNLRWTPFSPRVARGIEWHYAIDRFTDSHPLVARSRARFFPKFRHYSAVLVDLFYDHLLAVHFERFGARPLPKFAQTVYGALETHFSRLPAPMQLVMAPMIENDWLVSYAHREGIEYALNRIARRARKPLDFVGAWPIFSDDFAAFEADFLEFYPQLIAQWND